jgi:nitroreductase
MTTITGKYRKTNDFNEIVLERRSVKVYDPEVKISREEMTEILAEASRAPSAINMQPWRFLVIDSIEGKEKLAPLASFNQTQALTSSAVIAVFYDADNIEYIDEIFGKAVELGYMPRDVMDMQLQQAKPYYAGMASSDLRDVNLIDTALKDRFQPVMLISIGKAAKEGYPSYRLPVETITTWA